MTAKLQTLDELSRTVARLRQESKTIVQCHGVFDLVHVGHVRHFKAAKKEGDIVIVTVTADKFVKRGPGRPYFNELLRAEMIAALDTVDYVAIDEHATAVEAIGLIRPDVFAKGSDYRDFKSDVTGQIGNEAKAVQAIGGRVCFTKDITFSSSELLNHNFNVYPNEARRFLETFRAKHAADEIIQMLGWLRDLRVLVVGDTIVDQYVYCEIMGKSPKDNILTARRLSEETFAGGILAVANQIGALCGRTKVVTCLGEQNDRDLIFADLSPRVSAQLFRRPDGPTPTKCRFVDPAFVTKMFEVAELPESNLPEHLESQVCECLEAECRRYDLVVVVDFGHGFVGAPMIGVLSREAPLLAINAQSNSANLGYNLFTRYPRADYLCLDEGELRLAARDRVTPLTNLMAIGHIPTVAVTLGHRGSVLRSGDEVTRTPAFSWKVVDTMGAGDAYMSVTAPMVARGCPADVVGFVGNAIGALKVQIVGNAPVQAADLFRFIKVLLS